ncbi:hypothetical protein GCM10027062_35770 [Nocardioides hungaricus]
MGGRLSVLSAGVVATVMVLGVLALVQQQRDDGPGSAADAGRVGAAPVSTGQGGADRLPALGVQFHATWTHYTQRKRARVLDRIEQSGATWVRVDVGWAMLQPQRGRYDRSWAVPRLDRIMEQLRRRDLKVLVMFWLTPGWATEETDPVLAQYTSPDRPGDYARAIGWAAKRWGDVVDAWEIWNEPNLEAFYVGTDPATYADLLCRAAPAVRRNDRSAKVVFGGLMYNDDDWLQRAYDAGVGGCFDVLAVHSYQAPADAPPDAEDDGEVWNLAHLDAVRKTMLENGDRLPVWVTEFGWSVHENSPDTEPWRRGVTEQQQAAYAQQALEIMGRDFPYVKAAFWYKDAAVASSTDEHQEGYGLLDESLRPRPVLRTLARLYGRS